MLKNPRVWIGVIISAAALWFLFTQIKFGDFLATLRQANLIWFVPAVVVWLIGLAARAQRWAELMGGVPFWTAFHANNIGYMINMSLPLRLGELGRAAVIGQRTNVSTTKALSSVVADRLLDLLVVALLLSVFAQFVPVSPQLAAAARLTGGAAVLAVIGAVVVVWQSSRVETLLRALFAKFLPKFNSEALLKKFRELCDGFAVLQSPGRLARVLGYTAAIWVAALIVAYMILAAFLPPRLDVAGMMLVAANLGGAAPSAPGALGVQQLASVTALKPFGLPEASVVAYVFTWSLAQQLALIALGAVGLGAIGLSLKQVTQNGGSGARQ